jgi:hypothetical protein
MCIEYVDYAVEVECPYGEFGPWSHCSVTCGAGTQHRSRFLQWAPKSGDSECTEMEDKEERACSAAPCPGQNLRFCALV